MAATSSMERPPASSMSLLPHASAAGSHAARRVRILDALQIGDVRDADDATGHLRAGVSQRIFQDVREVGALVRGEGLLRGALAALRRVVEAGGGEPA